VYLSYRPCVLHASSMKLSLLNGAIISELDYYKSIIEYVIYLQHGALSISDYVASNDRLINEKCIGITAAEMKYKRKTAESTWTDYKTNTEFAKELNKTPSLDKIQKNGRNGLQHIKRMPRLRLPRMIKNYKPKGRRDQGRPLQ